MNDRTHLIRPRLRWVLGVGLLANFAVGSATLAQEDDSPDVLLVVAHPDDEGMFAATVYKVTHTLGGAVDLALVTDGSGGYRYSHLAEPIYGLQLTDEKVARQYLPAIRKQEQMAGGKIIGIRNYFFLDQLDHQYTENVDTVLSHVWDADDTRDRLREIMTRGAYDFVFVHLPIENFHAHHKGASILALEAAERVPEGERPVVLGSFVGNQETGDPFFEFDYVGHPGYPLTRVHTDVPPFVFNRKEALSEDGRLDYQIIVNWLIAEHKTQGTMQLLMNRGDIERFWVFESNNPDSVDRTREFFDRLNVPTFAVDTGGG